MNLHLSPRSGQPPLPHNHARYDAENRIVSVDGGATTYVYNAQGQRVQKSVGAAITDYVYDLGGHAITEINGSGVWMRGEIYTGGRHIATYANSTTYFNHSDWLGTERARTAMNGTLCETITSLPFGDGQATSGNCGDTSPLHFTGKERDWESNLDNFGFRYYSSSMGRFTKPDEPFAGWDQHDPQSFNLYTYVENNPLNRIDVDGHNVHVCVDTGDGKGGQTCFNLTDQQYKDLFNGQNGQQGINLPGGKFPNGNITCGGQICGSASYFEPGLSDDPIIFPTLLGGAAGLLKSAVRVGAGIIGDIFAKDAEEGGGLVIGKLADLGEPGAVGPGEHTLDLPDLGDPKANWAQNSSKLREAMSEGRPIKDVSAGKAGSNTGFLRAERNVLENHGWTLHSDGFWHPPNQ
jgi:RHS repeat-associated protein